MSSPLTQRIVEEYAGFARTLAAADAAEPRRRDAIGALETAGLPTSRDENWKYANLRPLERQRFTPAANAAAQVPELPTGFDGFARYVLVDGALVAGASAALATVGATVAFSAHAAPPHAAAGARENPEVARDQRLALLSDAFAPSDLTIRVVRAPQPARLEVLFVASAAASEGASYPRLQLEVESGASLILIERHLSASAAGSFVDGAVSIELGPGASLEHYRLQELNGRSIFFDTLAAQLGQDARYRLHGIGSGAQSARSTLGVRLAGERAQLALAIATLGERQQVQDTYARVEHAAPGTRTVQTFRGIAADRSRVACNGKIVVGRGAAGSDSQQSLRGLLAGPEAEIDVRPQLEIYTDEVRCSHGATAGKLDDNMLFYLLSRGLSPESAQRLLKWAFLEDAIAQITLPQLRRQIETRFAAGLHDETLLELL